MSRPALTEQQERAARRGAGDACVMAGAGSGKTTVLTERFATIAHRIGDARRIAALTFTDRAANEMRERIARAFRESARTDDERRAARDVEFAPISTIHSFCARLLKEHAVEAGVDPAFRLFDETEAARVLEDAYAAVERRRRRARHPGLAVLRLLGRESAARTVCEFLDEARGLGIEVASLRWQRGGTTAPDALAAVERALAAVDAAVAAAGVTGQELEAYRRARRLLPGVADVADLSQESARTAAGAAKGAGRKTIALPLPKARPFTPLRDAVFEAYETLAGAILDEIAVRDIEGPLRELVVDVDAEYRARKDALGALDFTDLEREACDLLERLETEGRDLEGRPLALLVDEYQDTNPLQARILERLRRPARGGPAIDQFAVGDPKQSIYRFRRADVSVLRTEWERVGDAGRERLTESFRSRPELVAFHNALFSRLLADGAAGIPYEAMSVPRAEERFHPSAEVPPEILMVDAGADGTVDRHDAEARAVARRIRTWIDDPAVVRTKIEKGADGEGAPRPRRLRYRDVAVLLRTRNAMKSYERALLAEGIPFHVAKGKGFYDTEEIADLVHLLRVVHDPRDAFAVAAWMTSPAVGATDEDLLAAFRGPPDPFAAAARLPRVEGAAAVVERLRRLSASSSLATTVAEAVEAVHAIPVALAQDGGERRARNVEKALDIAARLDAEGGHGLADFLRWLTDLKDREVEEPEASAGSETDSVALLTIHAAKGLEWPCVVLADASAGQGGHTKPYVIGRDGRHAWRLMDPLEGVERTPGGYDALAAAAKAEDDAERLRLLYVALTRAEERLVVSMSVSGANKDGAPRRLLGWGKTLWKVAAPPFAPGRHEVVLDDARLVVEVVDVAAEPAPTADHRPWLERHGVDAILGGDIEGVDAALVAEADAHWRRARRPVETLGRTPYVVTISDLLAFAESPRRYYEERVVGADGGAAPEAQVPARAEPDDPAAGGEDDPDAAVVESIRADRWDEDESAAPSGLDRRALGRAVHAVLERVGADGRVSDEAIARALSREMGAAVPGAARTAAGPAARAMVERFLASPTGAATLRAIAEGKDVRREVAFHARIKFPEKAPVAGFEALIVKGTIDLWLPTADGITILDYKTNSPHGRHRTADAIRDHYAPQLRLYALAAERVLGRDVAGAGLLLLDPAWSAIHSPVELPVDVSGDALHETRLLCRAFAVSALEDRYPDRWQALL